MITEEYLKETLLYAFLWSLIVFIVTISLRELAPSLTVMLTGASK